MKGKKKKGGNVRERERKHTDGRKHILYIWTRIS